MFNLVQNKKILCVIPTINSTVKRRKNVVYIEISLIKKFLILPFLLSLQVMELIKAEKWFKYV